MRIGRYELLQKLGAGGMGEVYCARDRDLGRDVALKFLPERFAADRERLARFSNEARAASSLNHPNIVTVHEIGFADGTPFIVMERVKGRTFRALMNGKPLKARRILDLAVQAADGLAKAHAAGIVHRDLKPENLMVTEDGLVKILDFGLAKLRAPDKEGQSEQARGEATTDARGTSTTHSSGDEVVGTVGYMSPEQAAGRAVDFRADQFSLGTVLYEMVAGRRAFKRDTPVQTLSAIIEADPEPLSSLNPAFPAPGRWAVERCLAKDPADRYASTTDLARELRSVREHLSEVSAGGPVATRPARRPRWWVAALGLALAAAVAVVAVPAWRDGLLERLQWLPLPAEKCVAVLPFRAHAADADEQRLAEGLFDYVVARLGQLERFQKATWVVPAVEVRQSGVTTAEGARRALGATLVVAGSLQAAGQGFVVTASLIDASTLRQLRATTFEVQPGRESLLERTVESVIDMLDLELGADAQAVLRAGRTGVVEASTLYAQALGATPYGQARSALERYDQERSLERAVELFQRALEQDPRYALAHAGLAEAFWRLSRYTKKAEQAALAEQHARRAVELDPLVAQAWVTLGIVHAGSGRAEEALQALQHALDRNPRSADAHREMANAYDRLGKKDEAEATFRKALELRPDDWVNHVALGNYLYRQNRFADAEQAYRRALSLVPDNARAWSNLGSSLYFQSKRAEAEEAWRKSLALRPTATAAANIGTLVFYEGRYADAARAFEQAVAIDDRDYQVWRNLAASYYWAPGERERARAAYVRAAELARRERELDPLNPRVHVDLADCLAMLGEAGEARAAAAEAARLGGGQASVARMLAGVHEQLGDRETALEWAGKAIALGASAEVERSPSLERLRADPRLQVILQKHRAAVRP
ncbi:MAG: tetratricopeptide repeat protein [Vicinamibacterales bacterium]|nr:tetratricopeptide repeat protein [Vicinamibacterales bacterium]